MTLADVMPFAVIAAAIVMNAAMHKAAAFIANRL